MDDLIVGLVLEYHKPWQSGDKRILWLFAPLWKKAAKASQPWMQYQLPMYELQYTIHIPRDTFHKS